MASSLSRRPGDKLYRPFKASTERKGRCGCEQTQSSVQAIKENRTLKQLSLAGSKIGEEGAFALLEAGSYRCTCSKLTATPETFS